MNSDTMYANLRARRTLAEQLFYFAEHLHEWRLNDGMCLLDRSDFAAGLRELAYAARKAENPDTEALVMTTGSQLAQSVDGGRPASLPRYRPAWERHNCPDCGHEHEGKIECGFYLGEEKFCRCESKASL
jgi:hypothetical protein